MENKKLALSIVIISFILCFAFVTIIILLIDSQQHTIFNQTQKLGENERIIQEQSEDIKEYESGEKFSKLNQTLNELQTLVDENSQKIRENLEKISQKEYELNAITLELNSTKERLDIQTQKVIEQERIIDDQNSKLDIYRENHDWDDELALIQTQKEQISEYIQQITQNEALISTQKEEIANLSLEIDSLKTEIQNQKAIITQQEILIRTGETSDQSTLELIQEKQQKIDKLQEAIAAQENLVLSLTEQNDALNQKLIESEALNAENDSNILGLLNKIGTLNDRITALEAEIEAQKLLLDETNQHFSVCFVAEGEIIDKQVVSKGEMPTPPTIPTKYGYTGAWSEFGPIEDNTLVYCIYTPIEYDICYDLSVSKKTEFRFATFYIENEKYTIDLKNKLVLFTDYAPIQNNTFSLDGKTYTIDYEHSCVIGGKKSYPIDNSTFIIDKIYKLDNTQITFENSVLLQKNAFELKDKIYTIDKNQIITDGSTIDISTYSEPSFGWSINLANHTLFYTENNRNKSLKIENDRFTLNGKTYVVDYVCKCFRELRGETQLKSDTLPTHYNITDRFIRLDKDISNYVYYINDNGKLSDVYEDGYLIPTSWEISGIDYLLSEDENFLYIIPLSQGEISISINWK